MPITVKPRTGEGKRDFLKRCMKDKHVWAAAKKRANTKQKAYKIAYKICLDIWEGD